MLLPVCTIVLGCIPIPTPDSFVTKNSTVISSEELSISLTKGVKSMVTEFNP